MSWEAKRERLDKLIKKGLIEEPCLDLPVIKQKFGIDAHDALLEEDFPPLPVIEPKTARWIDGLEDLEEQQLESGSNAYVPQEPGQQKQLQPTECDICGKRFQFPVNLKRHKWRPCYKTEWQEKTMELTLNQFKDYWEKLEDEKACKVISIKDVVLPADVTELQLNDIIGAVSSYVEASDKEYTSVVSFRMNPEAADGCPPFQEILDALHFLSDGTLFCGRLNPEMERIVFPHALSMDEIREQGLLASFEFLVEYCMAWADDENHISNLLEEDEEEAARKQTELLASTSKAQKSKSSASRRKQNAGKKEESDLNAQHPEDEEINTLKDEEEHDSSSRPNQRNSKEIEDYTEQDSCNVAGTQSSALPSIDDSVHDTTFPSLHREMASESMKSMKPCDVIDDGINDAGPLSSRQSTASTRKARKHSYAQRNERMQDQSKQSKKHTQNNSSKDEKELDRLSQLKKSDSKHPADKAQEFNNQEQASSDAAATLSDLVQSVGNFEQGYNTSSALNHKKVTESTVKGMEWADLADDIYDLLSRDDGCSISEIPLPENSGRGEWGGTLDNMADQAPEVDQQEHASSDAAATRSDLVQSVGNFVQGGGTSSALNCKKVTESTIKEIEWTDLPDDMNDLPPLPPLDGGGSLSEISLPETGGQSVVERLLAAQTLEAAAEILKEVVWGDLTNEDIELYSKPPALDSAPAVDDGGSLSMQPERSAEETEGGQWAGETPEKSEGGEGEGEDTNRSGGGQGERENTEAGCGSRSQQQYGENMRAERGSGQQMHIRTGHSRSHTIHYRYGGVTILRRTSEAAANIESPAAQRDPLPSKNKGPAEHEDSPSAPICVPRESADSTAVSAKSVAEEGEEKETPGETRAGPRQQQCLTQFLLQRRCVITRPTHEGLRKLSLAE